MILGLGADGARILEFRVLRWESIIGTIIGGTLIPMKDSY